MPTELITYGEGRWGHESGRLGYQKVPHESFVANNMWVNADGSLAVRPGLIEATPDSMPSGKVLAYESTPVSGRDGFFVIGDTGYRFDLGTPATSVTALTGSLASTPTRVMRAAHLAAKMYVTSYGDKSYVVDPTASTITALTGSPGGSVIESYGERLMVGDDTQGNRLEYSAAADFDDWPAANFIDVGDEWQITGLHSQRGHLTVVKQKGLYVLTGVPGVNDVLRQVSYANGTYRPHNSVLDYTNDVLWFHPFQRDHPGRFNGAVPAYEPHLNYSNRSQDTTLDDPPLYGIVAAQSPIGPDLVCFATSTGDKALIYRNGSWSLHTFGQTISGLVAGGPNAGQQISFCDGGAAGVAGKVWVLNTTADTPGREAGSFMRAGDGSDTALAGSVSLPEWWAGGGQECVVRSVIVDFAKYSTGSASTNHFDLNVDALRVYDSEGVSTATTQSFDEVATAGSAGGDLHRVTKYFGDQGRGAGFRLRFTNVRGLALHRVLVEVDVSRRS